MEIKMEIEPEGWGEDMKWVEDNYSELVKKCPDQWVDRGDYVEKYLSSFNTSSVEETTSLARDALKKSFLEYRLIPKSFFNSQTFFP